MAYAASENIGAISFRILQEFMTVGLYRNRCFKRIGVTKMKHDSELKRREQKRAK